MLEQSIQALNIQPDGVYLDGTLGRAGHSKEIARQLTDGRLICIDRDQDAIREAAEILDPWMDRITLVHGNFKDLDQICSDLSVSGLDGMIFDLGVSSPQLDDPERGFSYMKDAPLDMRMDQSESLNAYTVVNEWTEEELKDILWRYGEERYAPAIAKAIVRCREKKPIETTLELVKVIKSAMPSSALREKQHPAKRTFQAIRIAVNDELRSVERMMELAVPLLNPKGRLVVLTFHSLEDRIVKSGMAQWAKGCTCPPDFPVCVCGKTPQVRLLFRKPVTADADEVLKNPRARSAKLRAAEKI